MPEAPDVEVFRRYLDSTALHQTVTAVDVVDSRLLRESSEQRLTEELPGRSLEETSRVGKYLFVRLGDASAPRRDYAGYLLLHFGMTGDLVYYKHAGERPDFAQFVLGLGNGYQLAYTNRRILGRIEYLDDIDRYLDEHDIGPDALGLSEEEFRSVVHRGRGAVKTTLMNQRMMSGLGNVYSDEILFQSGVHPESVGRALPENAVHHLYRAMHDVFEAAVDAKAQPDRMPDSFLIRHRDAGASFGGCADGVVKKRVSGRSCYFCPSRQTMYQED